MRCVGIHSRACTRCLTHCCITLFAHLTPSGPILVAQDGVLNVIVGTQGTFVLNKQAPNLQLWLSSPISGPLRYDFSVQDAAWLNVRDGHSLLNLLADDFEKLTKKPVRLEAVAVAVREAAVES